MATSHTYLLSQRDRCLGEHGEVPAVAAALRALWQRLASEKKLAERANEEAEPNESSASDADEESPSERTAPVDGVSVWLDDARAPQVRLVWRGVCEPVEDPAVRAAFAGLFEAACSTG